MVPCWHLGITFDIVVALTVHLIKPEKLLQYHRGISLLQTSYEIVGNHNHGFRRNK
jgi:hypothetical protein